MDLNEKIKELQYANNLSDEKLSKIVGLTNDELSNIKNGTKEINVDVANKFAKVFKITLDELVNGQTEKIIHSKYVTNIIIFSILLVILPISFPFVMQITDMFDIIFFWLFIPTLWVAGISFSIIKIIINSRRLKKKTH